MLQNIMDVLISIIRQPALFIGIISFLGLVIQRKQASDVIQGTIKTIVGMIILLQGVNIVIGSIQPLSNIFANLFSTGTVGDWGTTVGPFMVEYGSLIGMVMLAAFVGNILVARFTKFKSIYLTGNLLIWFPMLFISAAVEAGITNQVVLFIFAFVLDMALITISPQLMRPLVKKLTGSEDFTIGHTTAPFCLMGAGIGKLINKPEESTEDLNIPKSLDFFRSTTITSGLVMITLYFVLAIILFATGRGEVVINSGLGQYWYTAAIMQGLTFAAGTVVLLHGVRMVLAEIVPAFKGISDKFVPGAIPALDIPLVFPYGQNALMIGFIISMVTSVATIFIMGSLGWLTVAVIPLTVACFFDVAPAAIFANKYGGRKAAYLTAALGGILMIVLVAFTIPMIANTTGTFLQLYGGNEFSIWTAIAKFFANLFA